MVLQSKLWANFALLTCLYFRELSRESTFDGRDHNIRCSKAASPRRQKHHILHHGSVCTLVGHWLWGTRTGSWPRGRRHGDWPRPEFRQILFEIWVASALREFFGKFGPVAGLSAREKSLRKFWTFIAHWPPQPTPATPRRPLQPMTAVFLPAEQGPTPHASS